MSITVEDVKAALSKVVDPNTTKDLVATRSVRNLKVVDKSWGYGPIEVDCPKLSVFDAQTVTIDANYQPTKTVKKLTC